MFRREEEEEGREKRFSMLLKLADHIQNDLNRISLEYSSPFSQLAVG